MASPEAPPFKSRLTNFFPEFFCRPPPREEQAFNIFEIVSSSSSSLLTKLFSTEQAVSFWHNSSYFPIFNSKVRREDVDNVQRSPSFNFVKCKARLVFILLVLSVFHTLKDFENTLG